MTKRTTVLGTRLTGPERERVQEHARLAGCTPCAYVRQVLNADPGPAGKGSPRAAGPAEARRGEKPAVA